MFNKYKLRNGIEVTEERLLERYKSKGKNPMFFDFWLMEQIEAGNLEPVKE